MSSYHQLTAYKRHFFACVRFFDKPEHFFLVVGGVFVVLFALINPPLQALDEPAHFYRIAELSKGHPVAKQVAIQDGVKRFGDTFPKALIKENEALLGGVNKTTGKYNTSVIHSYLSANGRDQGLEIVGFEGSALYTPAVYIPQTVAYKGTLVVTKSVLLRMYAARLANGLVWLVLVYLAIKLIPIGKWTLVVFGLLPANVFLAGSMSADALVIAVCFLFIAYTLRLRTQRRLSNKQIFLLGLLMSFLALAKSAYFPVLLIVFLLPRKLFKHYKRTLSILLGIPLALSLTWSYTVRPITTSLHSSFFPGTTFTPADQIHYSLSHPFFIFYAFANSIFSGISDLTIRDLFGTFTWSRVLLPLWLQMFGLLLLIFVLCYQLGRTSKYKFSRNSKVIPGVALAGSFCAIYLIFYLVWIAPGNPNIGGVQGRYFLPLLPLLIPIFTSRKIFINLKEVTFVRTVQGGTLMMLSITIIMLAQHFY